ncbi:MAG TPA: NAD(P)/FAD-dependent oxidoreductase, partial [Frankiaceae bacterium]|nr:NAD(P)/FAD-dependent oxidoreductase [Frankiaceae bacterium]
MERVVVVGAGLAGARACEELRRQGYAGRLTLVGAEPHPPYDRPPLSKALLRGETDDTTLPVDLTGVQVLLGRRASGLRPGRLETDGGVLDWDGLVLATGAHPVRLPGDGPQRVLRTVDDARALRAALRPGARVAIVGAGWIGAEVATAAAGAGCAVTVVEAGPAPLAQALGEQVGAWSARWYEQAGVELRTGTGVAAVTGDGLALADGTWLAADVVLVGVGVRPATGWLEGSGLALDRPAPDCGVVV